jgi:uncharacterized protein
LGVPQMRFYTTAKLGPNRELLPSGFTLFKNVSVARTGEQVYGPEEVGIDPGPDGLVYIDRSPEEVFRPEAIDSLNFATFVIDHPIEDVSPINWQHLAHGMFGNARRGTGEQKNELVADLVVTTAYGLSEIDNGKREISLGYDADYIETGVGRGEQRNIVINHGAGLVAGRCGERCAVKDHVCGRKGIPNMAKKSWKDKVLDAIRNKDEEGAKAALEEVKDDEPGATGGGNVHIHLGSGTESGKPVEMQDEEDPTEKRFKGLEDSMKGLCDKFDAYVKDRTKDEESEIEKKQKEQDKAKDKAKDEESEAEKKKAEEAERAKAEDDELEEEAPDGTGDKARGARDSAYLVDSFENTKMLAEIIAPGVKIPTFDKAADPKKMFKDCVCGLRRKALQMGTLDAGTAALIDQVRGRTTDSKMFDTMTCGQVRTVFNSVGALKKVENNAAVTRDSGVQKTAAPVLSPSEQFAAASAKRHGYKL